LLFQIQQENIFAQDALLGHSERLVLVDADLRALVARISQLRVSSRPQAVAGSSAQHKAKVFRLPVATVRRLETPFRLGTTVFVLDAHKTFPEAPGLFSGRPPSANVLMLWV
jgi:hypothetical protein